MRKYWTPVGNIPRKIESKSDYIPLVCFRIGYTDLKRTIRVYTKRIWCNLMQTNRPLDVAVSWFAILPSKQLFQMFVLYFLPEELYPSHLAVCRNIIGYNDRIVDENCLVGRQLDILPVAVQPNIDLFEFQSGAISCRQEKLISCYRFGDYTVSGKR